jgi:hypothetical protein
VSLLVEVGLSTGAGVSSTYLRLNDPVSGLLDTGVLAPDDLFTDLSLDANGFSRVLAFEIDRSSTQGAGALVEYAAGTLTLSLRDDNGDLDPTSIAEPIPGSAIRLSKVWAGAVYPLFTGTIDSWLPEHRYPDQAVLVVTATDLLESVGGYERGESAPVGAGDNSGTRVDRVLDQIGWPGGQRDVDTGVVSVAATTLAGNALEELRNVARAEVGEVWATPAGLIRFRNRYGLYVSSATSGGYADVYVDSYDSSTVQATFGSDIAGGELPFVGSLGISYDRSSLINFVRASRTGGTVYEVGDESSRSRYHDKGIEQLELILNTDDDVAAWAQYVLARDSLPKMRFTDVTVDARANEDLLYPQVLGRDFGDRIAVVRRPPGVAADTREAYIRGIHHSFVAPTIWQTKWELEPAVSGSPFFLDDVVHGLLDSGNVLIY